MDLALRRPRLGIFSAWVIIAKEDHSLSLGDASSDVIRYLGGRVHCIIRGGRGILVLRQDVQNLVELSMKKLHHPREGSNTLMLDIIW